MIVDKTDPYAVALAYLQGLFAHRGDLGVSLICADDLQRFHRQMLDVAETMQDMGEDKDFIALFPGAADIADLRRLSAEDFYRQYLQGSLQTLGVDINTLAQPQLNLGSVKDEHMKIKYTYPGDGVGSPIKGSLELSRLGGNWAVRLKEDSKQTLQAQGQKVGAFQRKARQDRAAFTPWNELFPVRVDKQWGYISGRGRIVIEPRFTNAKFFEGDRAPVRFMRKWGYIDANGRIAIKPQFDSALVFEGDVAVVGLGSDESQCVLGLIDREGHTLVRPAFDSVQILSKQGIAIAERDQQFGVIDLAGKVLAEFLYENEGETIYAWSKGALWLDERDDDPLPILAGDEIDPPEQVWGKAALRRFLMVDHGYGFLAGDGSIAIPPRFDCLKPFSEGLAAAEVDGEWGYINADGEWVIAPQFDDAGPFAEGIAPVCNADDMWGYIDRQGRGVTDFYFDWAEPMRNGLAQVRMDLCAIGYINSTGRFVWTPRE